MSLRRAGVALVYNDDVPMAHGMPQVSTGAAVLKTVTITLETVFKTVVTTDARQSINRSAVFLIVFLVVHVLGNLTFFGGTCDTSLFVVDAMLCIFG